MSQKNTPTAPTPLMLAPKPVNVFRWQSTKFANTKINVGGHNVQLDDRGWLQSDAPRGVEATLEAMDEATRAKCGGWVRKVLNQDDAWAEDIERADSDIERAEQEVARSKQRLAESQIALNRAKQRKVELDQTRQEYKDQVTAILAEAESVSNPAKPSETKKTALG